jgi:hypothetical protein
MGIGSGDLACLISLRRGNLLSRSGAVAEIGAQQLAKSFLRDQTAIKEVAEHFGVREPFPFAQLDEPGPAGPELLDANAPFARAFWRWLGFDYLAIDIDGSPDSVALDLNHDQVPPSLKGRYNLVTNFGTTEHVANQLNAFKIIHELTALNGLMIHSLPAQGHFNHGLVNYNPKFFWMLARSNGYKWIHVDYHLGQASGLPANIVDQANEFTPDIASKFASYSASDCALTMVLQKKFDIAYVAPIDVNTGSKAPNRELEERYWTVFRPRPFDGLA